MKIQRTCISMVECFVAASTGTAKLSDQVGRSVVLVDVAPDADQAIEELRRSHHGSATLWPRSFQPFEPQTGWNDWRLVPLKDAFSGRLPPPRGARIEDGRIRFPLPSGVTLPEFMENLGGALRHLRFHDVVRQPKWLEEMSDAKPLANILVHPRYTMPDQASFRDARMCTDLLVIDPMRQVQLIIWHLAATSVACGYRRGPRWR